MHARSTTVRAHPESIDAGIAHIRDEVMPMMPDMDGFVGMSMLVDRSSGRCVLTTAWQSKEAMDGTAERVRPLRERFAEILGGSPEVDEWEIAVMHRDHTSGPGACVRATWLRMPPEQVERGVDAYKMVVLPAMQEYGGFCSASLMLNRTSGRSVSSVTFDSRDTMDRTREQATELRTRVLGEIGGEVLEVAEFELALAHLRVPEMA